MNDIINEIIYMCGTMTICCLVFILIVGIILKIKEITYDAHQTSTELYILKRKCKKAKEDIENEIKFWDEESTEPKPYTTEIRNAKADSYKHCLEILDKLIESEEV